MQVKTILTQAERIAHQMAYQYRQDPSDLLSYCHAHIPALMSRINPEQSEKSQIAYIRKSLKGYMLHYLRDGVALIKTPRGKPPISVSAIHENVKPCAEIDTLPEWVQLCLESRVYGKRFANAWLRMLDT